MNKTLTLKNMVETYVNFSGDQRGMDKMWDAYYQMACVGFIDNVTWDKFSALCHGWFLIKMTVLFWILLMIIILSSTGATN